MKRALTIVFLTFCVCTFAHARCADVVNKDLPPLLFSEFLKGTGLSAASREQRSYYKEAVSEWVHEVRVAPVELLRYKESLTGPEAKAAKVFEVFRDYDPKTEIILGVREENRHFYLLANGWRFDGGYGLQPSNHALHMDLIHEGLIFRIRGVPPEIVEKIANFLANDGRISDLSCYSAAFAVLEKIGGLRFLREPEGLPIFPLEYISGLFDGRIGTSAGKTLSVQPTILGNFDLRVTTIFLEKMQVDQFRRFQEVLAPRMDAVSKYFQQGLNYRDALKYFPPLIIK